MAITLEMPSGVILITIGFPQAHRIYTAVALRPGVFHGYHIYNFPKESNVKVCSNKSGVMSLCLPNLVLNQSMGGNELCNEG